MFDSLRGKLQTVQRDLSFNFKSFRSTKSANRSPSLQEVTKYNHGETILDIEAGGSILHKYQQRWQEIRVESKAILNSARIAGESLTELHSVIQRRSTGYSAFTKELFSMSKTTEDLSSLIAEVASLEGLCDEVESSLTFLEVLCQMQEFQEKKLDQRFQLAVLREQKMAQLKEATTSLALQYMNAVERKAKRLESQQCEKIKTLEDAFEKDLDFYKRTGQIRNSLVVSDSNPRLPCLTESLRAAEIDAEDNNERHQLASDALELEEFLSDIESSTSSTNVESSVTKNHES